MSIAADDVLSIQNPYSEDLELQGTVSAGTKFLIPSLAYVATFTSDSALTDIGFSVEFSAVQPRCSKDLIATVDRQSFSSPRYPQNGPPPGTICEYRIQAEDPSQRVKLIMYRFSVNEPSYFRINLSGDKLFSESTVVREVSPASATYYVSEGDVMRLFFYGEANTRGYKLRYKMVP
ncbi:uncharacterized protein LOC119572853 [Penaeus monodon]|uniref:uncharacterized protein LOC119572853 n=1 Tax=Penaeus monodon TaxID=6687 RepID=UPI0018A7C605|nr:uncharacterized protein LOC119572853 [Penaeus monodon]